MLSLEWLKEKNVILKLLSVGYEMKNVQKVSLSPSDVQFLVKPAFLID